MVDVTAGTGGGAPKIGLPSLDDIIKTPETRATWRWPSASSPSWWVLILPLPSVVLDLFLAISITLSILILMTSLFIQTPLEFSSFPTVLLISTIAAAVAQPRLDPADPVARP